MINYQMNRGPLPMNNMNQMRMGGKVGMMNNMGMNQQFMYQQQRMNQPQRFNFFISGMIGQKQIAGEVFDSFKLQLRQTEWTNNAIYKNAKNSKVTTSIARKDENENVYMSRNNFASYLIDTNKHLSEFKEYANNCEEKKYKLNEEISKKKAEFMEKMFPNESQDISFDSLMSKIKSNRAFIVSKDPELYKKTSNLLISQMPANISPPPAQQPMQPLQPAQNQNSYVYQSSQQPFPNTIYQNLNQTGYVGGQMNTQMNSQINNPINSQMNNQINSQMNNQYYQQPQQPLPPYANMLYNQQNMMTGGNPYYNQYRK